MARTSPTIKVALLVFVILFALLGFAQNSTGTAAAQPQAGPRVQLEGELQIQYQDFKDHSRVSYTLKLPNGKTVPLQFMKNPPTRFLTGDHVKVDGEQSGSGLVLYSGSTSVTTSSKTGSGGSTSSSSTPVPNTFGPQSTLVILVNFQDNATQPWTVADVQNSFSGPVNNFFVEASYGQTSIAPTIVGWYTIPESITTCNTSSIATDAQNAATANGVNLAAFTRYVYLFPLNSTCNFAGSSTVGGNPSQSWLNGTLDPAVVNHELGHSLGLWHSHGLNCGTSSVVCSNGTVDEYGDQMDVMGAVQTAAPDYNAFQKERLGWLNYGTSPMIQTVTGSGTYTITPYENGSGPNALKVLQSTNSTTGAKTWYYLEARQAVGVDSFLTTWPYSTTQNETTGVLFHLGTDGNGNSSLMLNMTPATPTYNFEMSLAAGQTFQDSVTGLTFSTTAVSSTGATIQITTNGSSCTPASPTVTVTPAQSQSVTPGTAVSFTATVTDNDSTGCSSSTFNLGDVLPSGWAGTWNAPSLSLLPGKSGSSTLTVTSPTGAPGGSYSVAVNASDATSYSGSAPATYVVATSGPLTVSVTTNQSSYQPGQTVGISITVSSGTSPVPGATVTATVTSPAGRLTTLKGTAGSNGVALLKYKLSRGAPAGTYGIGATATATTSTTSAATATAVANATFTVQ